MTIRESDPNARALRHYLSQRLLGPARIESPPPADLRVVITIPSHDEPDLLRTLHCLANCKPLDSGSVDVLIFINSAACADPQVHIRNIESFAQAQAFAVQFNTPQLRFHALVDNSLSGKHVGVGLARKIVMDEGLIRLAQVGATSGIIVGLDADCICDGNYLRELVSTFASTPQLAGASIAFEHPLDDTATCEAIAHYELFLRYYRLGLVHAGSMHAFHTVGSSMAVRAQDYAALGGMNRRQAGEDFYFLQKFMDTGRYVAINTTTVRPAARESHRVPFGTGAAIRAALHESRTMALYDPAVFADLRCFFDLATELQNAHYDWHTSLPTALRQFLVAQDFSNQLAEIRANVASAQAFTKRLKQWMNGFRCMKFARFAALEHYPKVDTDDAATTLLRMLGHSERVAQCVNLLATLDTYRELDRAM
jgi:hypothetical protein